MAQASTIYALSSGLPPAGIAVIRISGAQAGAVLADLTGPLPPPRRAALRSICGTDGHILDRALILWFPGPASATGEDLAELHLHGGRAIVDAVLADLGKRQSLRAAEGGEFTRRALLAGRIDLMEAEGLAELLAAETADQHRQALAMSGGAIGQAVADWQHRLLTLSAQVEAWLDFSDEEDVEAESAALVHVQAAVGALADEWQRWLAVPPAERLRDGVSVVIAGPPNSGKSTLINVLTNIDAAIVSPLAGTTRDVIEVPVAIEGIPFRFADTAGLRDGSNDIIEQMGMARALDRLAEADILLWLGEAAAAPDHPGVVRVASRADIRDGEVDWGESVAASDAVLSALTGAGVPELRQMLVQRARILLPRAGEVAMNRRQRGEVAAAHAALVEAGVTSDPLVLAEALRSALVAFDRLTGKAGTEAMLDALFGRFCIGK